MEDRIKCGQCQAEYTARKKEGQNVLDYSCPVCGFGSMKENFNKPKKVLLDWRVPKCN